MLPVQATGKDGVARDKEARAVHGEPRPKTRNEGETVKRNEGETVKRDGLMQIKILWRRESYPVAMVFARDVIRVGWRRH